MSAPPEERFKSKQANFQKALAALEASVDAPVFVPRDLSGIIKDFEITYELSWTTLKVYLEELGHQTGSARETFARAYQLHQLKEEDVWIDMIRDRNLAVHTYNENLAQELVNDIRSRYLPALQSLRSLFTNH